MLHRHLLERKTKFIRAASLSGFWFNPVCILLEIPVILCDIITLGMMDMFACPVVLTGMALLECSAHDKIIKE